MCLMKRLPCIFLDTPAVYLVRKIPISNRSIKRIRMNESVVMKPQAVKSFRKSLLRWYERHHRALPWRGLQHDPYAVWVSEVMLQQTRVQSVVPFFERFLKTFPDIVHLARADLQDVLLAWEGMGYYARARNLHQAAKIVVSRYGGKLPASFIDFYKLPGVGDYISSAVMSIAFQQPYAVVDGNVKRVLARLFELDWPLNSAASHKRFKGMAEILLDPEVPGIFNQAVMELGAVVCAIKHPLCRLCPGRTWCRAFLSDRTDVYPRRIQRNPLPEHRIAVGVVFKNGRVLITRRKPEGLLGGLWEFPGGKVQADEDAETACIREIKEEVNLVVAVEKPFAKVKHAYTHFKIVMDVFLCRMVSGSVHLKGPVDYRWAGPDDLLRFPFPGANRKFIPQLLGQWSA